MSHGQRKPSKKVIAAIVLTAAIFWALVVLFRIVAMANDVGPAIKAFT